MNNRLIDDLFTLTACVHELWDKFDTAVYHIPRTDDEGEAMRNFKKALTAAEDALRDMRIAEYEHHGRMRWEYDVQE